MNIFEKDLYKILQVTPDANLEVINSAYRALAEKYHPSSRESNPEKYSEINQAYEVLCNPLTRKEYDQKQLYKLDNKLPLIQPVLTNKISNFQDLIHLIYENIHFENVNHNPTKCRVYQEIYDEITQKKNEIENSDVPDNPIWKILKTYEDYLPEKEFNSIMLLTAKILNIPAHQAESILSKTSVAEFASKKTYFIIASLFITCIIAVLLAYIFIINGNKGIPFANSSLDSSKTDTQQHSNSSSVYFARIVDLGMPVNLRSAPTTEWDNVVTKLQPNEMVEVVKHEPNGWYYVKKDNNEGYIYGGLLQDNDYIDAYAVVEILPEYVKVYDKDKKILRALKQGDRFIVLYHDNNNYYISTEKGELIKISKEFTMLDNKQKTVISYIDEAKKQEIPYFVPKLKQVFIEDSEEPQPPEQEEISPVDTRNMSVDEYLENIKATIMSNWKVPSGLSNYECVITFQLNNDGQVTSIELYKSSGNETLDESSINAVQNSSPFAPFPASLQKDSIEIKMNFDDQF